MQSKSLLAAAMLVLGSSAFINSVDDGISHADNAIEDEMFVQPPTIGAPRPPAPTTGVPVPQPPTSGSPDKRDTPVSQYGNTQVQGPHKRDTPVSQYSNEQPQAPRTRA